MFNAHVGFGIQRFVLPALDAVKMFHDSAILLVMGARDASSCSIAEFDSKWRVFQVTVSLNIRKHSIAENGEGSSKKQLELPRQHPSSRQLVLNSRFTH